MIVSISDVLGNQNSKKVEIYNYKNARHRYRITFCGGVLPFRIVYIYLRIFHFQKLTKNSDNI